MPPARIVLWVLSLGGFALLARALLGAPPPVWLAGALLAVYVTLAVVGVLVPQLELYGEVVWRGDPGAPGVALTFDDGPHPVTTGRVLALLEEAGVTATFFVIGEKARAHPEVLRDIVRRGHALGLHSDRHPRVHVFRTPARLAAELRENQRAVEDATGLRPLLFRPPIGHVSPRTVEGARRAGVRLVAWTVRARDGVGAPTPEAVAEHVVRGLAPGAIVALHDADERDAREPASVAALPLVLAALRARGLPVVPLAELVEVELYAPPTEASPPGPPAAGSSSTNRAPGA